MKPFPCQLSPCLLAALLLTGCNRAPDPRIAELEKKIADLEKRSLATEDFLQQTATTVQQKNSNNAAFYRLMSNTFNDLTEVMTNSFANVDAKFDATERAIYAITNRQPVRYIQVPAATTVPDTFGLPASIYAQIVLEAQMKYPTDFEMQEYKIKEQATAYRRLHP